jgi:hypothetical protein
LEEGEVRTCTAEEAAWARSLLKVKSKAKVNAKDISDKAQR